MKFRAVGYPRVSSESQAKLGDSLDAQAEAIERFCRENDIELVAHFRETVSAATIAKRACFKAALRFVCHEDKADLIIVTNLDRFTRSVFGFEAVSAHMQRKGKRFISVQQRYLTPLEQAHPDDEDELTAARQHMAIVAEAERKKIKRRCWGGRMRKVDKGGWIGHRPWYEVDIIQGVPVVNRERLAILRLMRIFRLQGKTCNWIEDYLNGKNALKNPDGTRGRKIPTASERPAIRSKRETVRQKNKGIWRASTILRMVKEYETRRINYGQYQTPA